MLAGHVGDHAPRRDLHAQEDLRAAHHIRDAEVIARAAHHADCSRGVRVPRAMRSASYSPWIPGLLGRPSRRGPGATCRPDARGRVRGRHRWGRRVVLCVAAKRPHKNQELLIRPSTAFGRRLRGARGSRRALRGGSARAGRAARRCRAGALPRASSPTRARRAVARGGVCGVPHPREGFGLPVSRRWRVASRWPAAISRSCARSVGKCRTTSRPGDPVAAAKAIEAAWAVERARPPGRERASRFSWRAAARGTLEAYKRGPRGGADAGRAQPRLSRARRNGWNGGVRAELLPELAAPRAWTHCIRQSGGGAAATGHGVSAFRAGRSRERA